MTLWRVTSKQQKIAFVISLTMSLMLVLYLILVYVLSEVNYYNEFDNQNLMLLQAIEDYTTAVEAAEERSRIHRQRLEAAPMLSEEERAKALKFIDEHVAILNQIVESNKNKMTVQQAKNKIDIYSLDKDELLNPKYFRFQIENPSAFNDDPIKQTLRDNGQWTAEDKQIHAALKTQRIAHNARLN